MKIILASASPRRKELLKEEKITKELPSEIVEELSYQKAVDICGQLAGTMKEDFVVIGADTIVSSWNKVMGKPKDKEEAFDMLWELQGKSHQVYTGVTLAWKYQDEPAMFYTFNECTDVTVFPMTEEEIEKYIDSKEPMDKAGAYAIQGRFAAYVQGICGDYANVVGLPVGRLYQEMKKRELL